MAVILWTSSIRDAPRRRVASPVFSRTRTDHRVELLDEEDQFPDVKEGDVLVALGGACVDSLKGRGMLPKNRGIKSLRGQRHEYFYAEGKSVPFFVSYDPAIVDIDSAREPEIIYDLQLACRLHDTGSVAPAVGKYKYVDNFNKVISQIRNSYKKSGIVTVAGDLETLGLDRYAKATSEHPGARIVSISFTVKQGTAYIYRVPESGIAADVKDQIEIICTSPKVAITGANWKYDAGWIWVSWGIQCTNHKFDTGIVGCLLDENRSNSLNLHAKVYTAMGGYDDDFNKNHKKGRMDLVLKDDPAGFKTYAGGDTDACLRVTKSLRKELSQDKALAYFYENLLQPASDVFTKLEHRGVYVDAEQYDRLQVQCEEEMADAHDKCLAMMPRRLKLMYDDNLSITRPTLIKEFLFTRKGLNLKPSMYTEKAKEKTWQYASTTAEHLQTFATNPDAMEFMEAYAGFNGAKKTLSTYIIGFRKHLRSDGMFHPSYNLYKGDFGGGDDSGTVTGRLSTSDPAYQTIPKHTKWAKPLRTTYIAPPGMAILKLDFSQGELRVAACVAGEDNMIAAYNDGIDMHLKTGAQVFGISLKKAQKWKRKDDERVKPVRQGGKAGNFGLLYTMAPAGFVIYAWNTFGVRLTLDQAKEFHKAFFALYPGLATWHDNYRKIASTELMIRNPLGRIRHLPLINARDQRVRKQAERQCINSPIQSCLSDMMLLAMVLIDREYPDLHMFGMTHDDIGIYVPEDEVELWARRVKDIMENLPLGDFDWYPELDFDVDAEASHTNLAEVQDLIL
jgi:DNA polymerase I-like protein with 3'-5' exonuclease and polymerase domains